MAIRSFPYVSVDGDRKITATNEAERIDQIVDSGIIFDDPTSFECQIETGTMNINIAPGSAIIKGHGVISNAAETVTISDSESAYSRIDLIVLESNTNTEFRKAYIKVIKGVGDATPQEPELSSGVAGISQIKLAKVLVPSSVLYLDTATITDLRAGCFGKHNHTKHQITDIEDCMVDDMFKNGFINGDFQVWQNGTTINPSATNKWYAADMWKCKRSDGAGGIITLQTGYTSLSVVANHALRVKRDNGDTSLNPINIAYNFGTTESMKYRGRKITVSFKSYIGENAAGSFIAYIYGGTGIDEDILNGYTGQVALASCEFVPTNSFHTFTFTTENLIDTTITELAFMVVYTPTATATGEYDHFDITNCNWSATDFYVPFSPKSFSQELQDCMAYYEKSYDYNVVPGAITNDGAYLLFGGTDHNGTLMGWIPFMVEKLRVPNIIFYNSSDGTTGNWCYARNGLEGSAGVSAYKKSKNNFWAPLGTGLPWSAAYMLGHWVADARI